MVGYKKLKLTLKNEDKIILELCKEHRDRNYINSKIIKNGFNWEYLLSVISEHEIEALVLSRLMECSLPGSFEKLLISMAKKEIIKALMDKYDYSYPHAVKVHNKAIERAKELLSNNAESLSIAFLGQYLQTLEAAENMDVESKKEYMENVRLRLDIMDKVVQLTGFDKSTQDIKKKKAESCDFTIPKLS